MHIVTTKESLKFVLNMCANFKFGIFIMLLVAFAWAIDASLGPYLIKIMLDRVAEGIKSEAMSFLLLPAIAYIALGFTMTVIFRLHGYFVEIWMIPLMRQRIGNHIFGYLLKHSHNYYQNNFSGSLANKVTDLTSNVPELIQITIDHIFSRFLGLGVAVLTLWTVNIKFAIMLLVWGVSFMTYAFLVSKKLQRESIAWSELGSLISGKIVDALSNVLSIRLFARKKQEKVFLNQTLDKAVNAEQKMQWTYFWIWFVYGFSYMTTEAIVLYNLVMDYKNNLISVGDFALVLTINLAVVQFFWQLALEYSDVSKKLGKITQALQMTTKPLEITDHPDAIPLKVTKGEIVFDDVTFLYKGSEPLFKNLSVRILGGQKVGLVGYSGGGKTSFVNLILRLYDVTKGRILIDDQPIHLCTQDSLHEAIGMIPQDPSLFHRSLLENIGYGKSEASEAEIIQAAKHAHAHEFINALPENYASLVGERGVKLSGGQRQRIAIARAMLKNAPILMLDEATSQLDSLTESDIQDSLWELMQNKTTLVIAHRLSTLLHMDRILVFEKGRIIQDGSHAELSVRDGLYKTLWEAQVGGFLPDKVNADH
jgi:ATP-binding cassette subfamily B protein